MEELPKLRRAMLIYFAYVLKQNRGNRKKTAKDLGISYRAARSYVKECIECGVEVEVELVDLVLSEFSIFATNDYRIKYRDRMLNSDKLPGKISKKFHISKNK